MHLRNLDTRPAQTSLRQQPRHETTGIVALLLTAALCLTACGGGAGGDTGAVTTKSSQAAIGTVTGFGSVFVDGVELQDATASTQTENADGSYTNVALKLGQRVEVTHDGKGTASKVTVDAAVIGKISALDTAAGTLTVAGQAVKVNTDAALGPVTTYGGGYTALSSAVAGDLVEVHGSPAYDTVAKVYVVTATRLEKQASISAVRVSGKVANLGSSSFKINGLTVNFSGTTALVPAGTTLANDQAVLVWGASGSLVTTGGVTSLTATRIRVVSATKTTAPASGSAQIAGVLSNYNAAAGSFEIEGNPITLGSSTTFTPSGKTAADLKNGAYVQVSGVFDANGKLAASSVRIREGDTTSDTSKIKLIGPITGFMGSNAFTVRSVPVDATSATLAASCAGVNLANDVVVEVVAKAQANTDVVLADTLACPTAKQIAVSIRELAGTAGTVNSGASSFLLTPTDTTKPPVTVLWNDKTAFTGITAATLDGAVLRIEAYVDAANAIVAREIRAPNTKESDAFESPEKWTEYRKKGK